MVMIAAQQHGAVKVMRAVQQHRTIRTAGTPHVNINGGHSGRDCNRLKCAGMLKDVHSR